MASVEKLYLCAEYGTERRIYGHKTHVEFATAKHEGRVAVARRDDDVREA